MNNFPFEISSFCMESYPCKHYVENTETGKTTIMDGIAICKLLTDAGLSRPHFNEYNSPAYLEYQEKLVKATHQCNNNNTKRCKFL